MNLLVTSSTRWIWICDFWCLVVNDKSLVVASGVATKVCSVQLMPGLLLDLFMFEILKLLIMFTRYTLNPKVRAGTLFVLC